MQFTVQLLPTDPLLAMTSGKPRQELVGKGALYFTIPASRVSLRCRFERLNDAELGDL
jgi:hypothetical protein